MKNSCENILKIIGNNIELKRFSLKAKGIYCIDNKENLQEEAFCLEKFFTVPDNAKIESFGINWEKESYGCRKNSQIKSILHIGDEYLEYKFSTYFVPAIRAIKEIAAQYPELKFILSWKDFDSKSIESVEFENGEFIQNMGYEYKMKFMEFSRNYFLDNIIIS